MTTGEPSLKKLGSLLKRVKSMYALPEAEAPVTVLGADRVLNELMCSMLMWDATTSQARHALHRLQEHLVDLNELRVCVAEEIAEILGEKYPFAIERSLRLRTLLSDIYHREHSVHLTHLEGMGKREARSYLESLEGVPHFVAARTFAFALGGHAVPVDERLRSLLISEEVINEAATCASLSGWLERSIGADDIRECLHALQAWSDDEGHTPKREALDVEPPAPPRPAAKTPPQKASPKADAKSHAKSEAKAKPASKKAKSSPKPRAAAAKPAKPARKASSKPTPSKDSKA
ncbi:MAG: hypothetical protein WC718_05170 [Phycisphaerales bacterium]